MPCNQQVNCIEDLEAAKDLIKTRPILTTARCRKPYDDTVGNESDVSYLDDEYIVLINTAHAEIARQFETAFSLAEQFLREGKNFRVSVSSEFNYLNLIF